MNRGFLRWQSHIHQWLYRRTGGRIGGNMGAPVLLLTTTGRKSGQLRTTPLFYLVDGNQWAVVASNAGSDKDPAWWLNLQSQPEAKVQIVNKTYSVRGRQATKEECAELWPHLVALFSGYADYQAQTTRQIPVVVLEKASRPPANVQES